MTTAVDAKGNYFTKDAAGEWKPAEMSPDGKSVRDGGEWKPIPAPKAAAEEAQPAFDQPAYMRPNPQGVVPAVERGTGLGARDMIEGVFGGPYALIAKGINATGLLPRINPLAENLTRWGFPQSETEVERGISAVQRPVANVAATVATGGAMRGASSPVTRTVGETLKAQPVSQAVAAGAGGAVEHATDNPYLGLATSVVTPLAGQAVRATGRAVENAIIGNVSAPDADLGRLAIDKYKIPIGAPDLTDNQMQRTMIDQGGKLPFSGARGAAQKEHAAWQGAIIKEMGDDATAFQPHVMERTATRLGQGFDDAAARTTIGQTETSRLVDDLATVVPEARKVLGPNEIAPLQEQIRDITALIGQNNGEISGAAYQALTRAKAPLDLLERSSDPNVRHFAGKVRDYIDDAFQRSATPADQDALSKLRYQYRIMRTVDPLVAGSRDGNITPAGFMQQVKTASRRFDSPTGGMAYTGGGNIGELAKIGNLMRKAPDSGTADRAVVNLAATGNLAALAPFTPETALTIGSVLAANRAAGSYLRSGATTNRLIENALGTAPGFGDRWQKALQTGTVAALEAGLRNPLMQD
ncbi:MAG TPA: hypothetical protein VJV39_09175 [Dongiaceae bacterium]|nr:hypothetical protein [Dongiaceae bacterium]